MTGAWRYTTNADCQRIWHWFARVGKPEIARAIPACVKAGALALPLIGAPAATPIPVRPVLPPGGPFWAGETGPVGIPFGSPFAPAGALSPFAGGALADVGGFGPVGSFGYAGGGAFAPAALGLPTPSVPVSLSGDVSPHVAPSAPDFGSGQVLGIPEELPLASLPTPAAPSAFAGADTGAGPQGVPEPASVAVMLAAVLASMLLRKRVA